MPSHTDEPGPHLTNDRADAPPMPPPVVALLSRAHRESAAFPRHNYVYLAVEASIRLAVAARRWPARGEVETRARSIEHPSVGTWVQLLIAALADAAKAGERGDIDLAFLENDDVVRAVDHLDGPEVDTKRVRTVVQLLEALPTHRNRNFGHGGVRSDAYHDESTRHLERILRESWNAGVFWPRGWTLEGASATEGRQDVVVRSGDAAMPLSPLVVVKGNRWFFLNRRTSRPNGKRARVTYLDYLSDAEDSYRAADELEPEDEGAALLGGVADLLGEAPTEKHTLTGAARYQIHQTLGAGGMGRVLLAFDRLEEKLVALKYPARREDDTEVKHRLDREATLLDRLARAAIPGVVRYLDRFDDHGPVFVMDHVDGCTLSHFGVALDRGLSLDDAFAESSRANTVRAQEPAVARNPWSRRTLDAYLTLLGNATSTLGAVHDAGIVHNDLKPDNIMVRRGLRTLEPVLIDFGIGKAVDADTRLTGMAGTPAFSAPEARRGEWSALSDVYSFGAILDEELCARDARIDALEPSERTLLLELVRHCKKEDATKRPGSSSTITSTLMGLASGQSARSRDANVRRRRWQLAFGALTLLAVVGLGLRRHEGTRGSNEAGIADTALGVSPATPQGTSAVAPDATTIAVVAASSSGTTATASAPLSDNCKDWLAAANVGRFEGDFGGRMKRLAEAIATRSKLRPEDLSEEPPLLPCANESDLAWDLYVAAVTANTASDAWDKNKNLVVSPRLGNELAERHRTTGWPQDGEIRKAIRRNLKSLWDGPKDSISNERFDVACTFGLRLDLEKTLCSEWLRRRTTH